MKRINLSRIVCGLLTLMVLCGVAGAQLGARAPRFSGQTLDGRTFNNDSFRGRALLLEFWATSSPHSRGDQAVVNDIALKYAGDRLVVLAVNVGEPEATVKKFLKDHPASCPVVADESGKLSARFGKHGVPYYVVIDRDGYIAGRQKGSAGEDALVSLLSLGGVLGSPEKPRPDDLAHPDAHLEGQGEKAAPETAAVVAPTPPMVIDVPQEEGTAKHSAQHSSGRKGSSNAPPAATPVPAAAASNAPTDAQGDGDKAGQGEKAGQETAPPVAPPVSPPLMIEVPQERSSGSSVPPKPLPRTVFVLGNGERLESDHYTMEDGVLRLVVDGQQRAIPLRALDARATIAANRERGIDLKIPQSRSEVYVAF